MRIVDRKTFLALPPNTLFAKYRPEIFEDFAIFVDRCGNDFFVQYLNGNIDSTGSDDMSDKLDRVGESFPMDFDGYGRDGCFDEDQLFAVYDEADVRALIERLQQCLP